MCSLLTITICYVGGGTRVYKFFSLRNERCWCKVIEARWPIILRFKTITITQNTNKYLVKKFSEPQGHRLYNVIAAARDSVRLEFAYRYPAETAQFLVVKRTLCYLGNTLSAFRISC